MEEHHWVWLLHTLLWRELLDVHLIVRQEPNGCIDVLATNPENISLVCRLFRVAFWFDTVNA